MRKILDDIVIKIPRKALKRGAVILDLEEYEKMKKQLEFQEYIDELVAEGEKEYKSRKAKKIKSLADLDK